MWVVVVVLCGVWMSAPAHASVLGQCLDVSALFELASSEHGHHRADRPVRETQLSGAALCLERGAQCDVTPQATSDADGGAASNDAAEPSAVATAVPCLLEEVEGRCAEADEKERVESLDEEDTLSALMEPMAPLMLLALACFGSSANCNGLPAPSPHKQLKSPMPTVRPDGVTSAPRKSGWWRTFEGPLVVEGHPLEGVREGIDHPPRR